MKACLPAARAGPIPDKAVRAIASPRKTARRCLIDVFSAVCGRSERGKLETRTRLHDALAEKLDHFVLLMSYEQV